MLYTVVVLYEDTGEVGKEIVAEAANADEAFIKVAKRLHRRVQGFNDNPLLVAAVPSTRLKNLEGPANEGWGTCSAEQYFENHCT